MKITVLGAGHMGSWIADELASDNQVFVFDLDSKRLKNIKKASTIKDIQEIKKFKPDMLINAVSLPKTKEAFSSVMPLLPQNCILCDLTSVKGDLKKFYQNSGFKFVSIHPMFGPTFANVENLSDENIIIIKESCQKGKDFFIKLAKKLKLHIFTYTFSEHDQEVAYSLGVPFSASLVFASCVCQTNAPGTTHRKHMETAKGVLSEDDYLLSEILFNPQIIPQIKKINSKLSYLTHIIKSRNTEIMKEFLDELRKNIKL